MQVSKTKNRFKTSFQQLKTGFPKNPVLTSLAETIKINTANQQFTYSQLPNHLPKNNTLTYQVTN